MKDPALFARKLRWTGVAVFIGSTIDILFFRHTAPDWGAIAIVSAMLIISGLYEIAAAIRGQQPEA